MEKIKQIYDGALKGIGDYPSWKKDWRWLAVSGVCVYLLVLFFRVSFAGKWDIPELWVNGERILATHDAYLWLAKAKGFGLLAGYPIAQATRFVHDITGFGFGTIGFWAPAFMGALVGVVCALWGWLLGGRTASIMAGLVGGLTPGFFYRSRLGYFDTDLFTLLMPMLMALLLAWWSSSFLRKGWFHGGDDPADICWTPVKALVAAFGIGLAMRFSGWWHNEIVNLNVLYVFMTAILVLAVGVPERKGQSLYGLCIILLTAFPGTSLGRLWLWPFSLVPTTIFSEYYILYIASTGCILAALLIYAFKRSVDKGHLRPLGGFWCGLGAFAALVASTGVATVSLAKVMTKLSGYLRVVTDTGSGSDVVSAFPIFPSIVQSIIEAKLVPLSVVLDRAIFNHWLGLVALIAVVIVIALRPKAIFLFPLIVLQVASIKLGIRFTMFGGAALVVCLGVMVYWLSDFLVRKYSLNGLIPLAVQIILGFSLLAFAHVGYATSPLTAVITKSHAEGLIELGEQVPSDSMVWTWWDWGYATMYYAGLEPVADGGKHRGEDVYPCAFVMSTDSPEKANRMIALSSQFGDSNPRNPGLSPAKEWVKIPRDTINAVLEEELSKFDYPVKAPQYVVVSWNDIIISKWITYFGNWNLATGRTQQAKLRMGQPGDFGFNLQRGIVQNKLGQGGFVSDIDVLEWGKVTNRHYGMNAISPRLIPGTPHLIANRVTGQTILADDLAYDSLLFRLMVDDPNNPEISKYFKLVVEKLPFVRIYEVVQNP